MSGSSPNATTPAARFTRAASLGKDCGPPVLTARQAFALLDIDRSTGYKAIRDGRFPVPVIRVGRVIRIPTASVVRLLEMPDVAADRARSA